MQIKKVFLALLLGFSFNILAYANNNCPRWFPLPALDGLAIVMPIYDASIIEADLDCDGVIDTLDNDIDGDGVANASDAFPLNSSESVDTDGDGIGNNADTDDDNDGYSDRYEIIAGSDLLNVDDVPNPNRPMSMWAIGDSTVAEYNDTHSINGELDHRGGWAEMIWKFTTSSQHVYNYARAVASSKSFYETFNGYDTKNFWEKQPNNNEIGAKESLQTFISPGNGAFLFIQFGHNDGNFGNDTVKTYANFEPGQYADYLTKYVREAKKLGAIPVLVTPVTYIRVSNNDENLHQYVGMDGNDGIGDYPQIMKEVASRENVLLLDLTQKSYDYFREHFEDDETILEAYGADYVHTNLEGATQVAKLVKELACEYRGSNQLDANLLCAQFKAIDLDEVTVHEDAEDGNTEGWALYGTTAGSTITNVEDAGSQVIELNGANGTANGFSFSGLNITSGLVASWRLKYSEDFQFFVQVRSTNSTDSNIYMEYTPDDISTGLDGMYIRNGLGVDAKDGTWHTFTRDIEADFKVIYPDDTITRIVGFSIRGSGRIDDISTSTRASAQTFTYDGHSYKIVKTASSWQDASAAAQAEEGYLANIGSIAENHEIYSRLNRFIEDNEYVNTRAINGGGASYVWIGANDLGINHTWQWVNNSQQFWSGAVGGNPVGGLYNNWGRDVNQGQHEPDNSGNLQHTAGIAITEWRLGVGNLGQASQWNDLNGASKLYYIIEYADQQEIVLNELKAFPTAEGAGAGASGGRGGKVLYVTNRKADGNGSLKWALTRDFNRTIVFAIGGRFNIDEGITLGHKSKTKDNKYPHDKIYSNFTLAGQTANKIGGVHLAHSDGLDEGRIARKEGSKHFNIYNQENMIFRYFDTRYNWQWWTENKDQTPSLRFSRVNNLIIDHISSGWSAYGLIISNTNFREGEFNQGNITIQHSLMHENAIHADGANHNVGMLLGKDPRGGNPIDGYRYLMTKAQWDNMGEFTIHKNAFIGLSHRFPNTSGGENGKFRMINNYIYGFHGDNTAERLGRVAGTAQNNFIGNVYQRSLYSPDFNNHNLFGYYTRENPEYIVSKINFYLRDNLFLNQNGSKHSITDTVQQNKYAMIFDYTEEDKTLENFTAETANLQAKPIAKNRYPVSIFNAEDVKEKVLANVGGNVRFRNNGKPFVEDVIDKRYLDWAKNNTGPDGVNERMGDASRFVYPNNAQHPNNNHHYRAGTEEEIEPKTFDDDEDGMPDTWEKKHNLTPHKKSDKHITLNWDFGKNKEYKVINKAGYTDLEMYLADIAGDFHILANQN